MVGNVKTTKRGGCRLEFMGCGCQLAPSSVNQCAIQIVPEFDCEIPDLTGHLADFHFNDRQTDGGAGRAANLSDVYTEAQWQNLT